jgi:hypothetical protein
MAHNGCRAAQVTRVETTAQIIETRPWRQVLSFPVLPVPLERVDRQHICD